MNTKYRKVEQWPYILQGEDLFQKKKLKDEGKSLITPCCLDHLQQRIPNLSFIFSPSFTIEHHWQLRSDKPRLKL